MKKLTKFLTLLLSAGLLASCNGAPLPFNKDSSDDSDIDTPYEDYILPVTSVSFPETEKNISLIKGETHDYKFTLEPKRAEARGVRWQSEDDSVATIDNGKLTAIGGGKTSIIVSSFDEIFEEVKLNVEVVVPLTSFEIPESVNLGYKKTYQISPTISPSDSTQGQFSYTPSNSNVASVDENGLVTTNEVDGVCSIGVTSLALGETKYISINVSEVHATSVTLDKSVDNLEVGKSMKINATVSPTEAYEKDVIFSIDESSISAGLASISEDGVLSAYKEGTVKVTATNVLKPELNDSFDVTIFQVRADHINQDDVALSNLEPTYQLNPTYVDSSDNPVQPSIKKTTYQLMTVGAIELSETGLITFIEKGNAIVRIHDEELSGSTFKDVVVTCSLLASSVSISGSKSVYIGDSIELAVSSNPERASLSDGSISIEATGGREFASLDTSKLDTESKVTLTGTAEGTITLVATIGGVHSAEFKVSVANKPFLDGHVYLVGDKDYHTGTTQAGNSWKNAGQAFEFEDMHDTSMIKQFKAQVYLTADSLFKVRHDAEGWCNFDDPEGIYDLEHGSSFETGDVVVTADNDKNIKVVTTGSYDIYYKLYSSTTTASGTWWEVYIMQTPTLSVSSENVNVRSGLTTHIEAYNYDAPLAFVSADNTIATAAMGEGNKIIISGGNVGSTSITVTDSTDHEVTVNVLVTDRVFEENKAYLVGDHDYSTGTSAAGASWSNADKALLMDTDVKAKYGGEPTLAWRGQITFALNDTWKVRVGDFFTQKESWVEADPWYQIGGYNLTTGIALDSTHDDVSSFATGDVAFDNENNNVVVNSAGTYFIDYVHWNNEHTEGWYEVRISKKPTLELDQSSVGIDLSVSTTATVNASNVDGTLHAVSSATGVATVSVSGSVITITGVSAGNANITVSDNVTEIVLPVSVQASIDKTFHTGHVYIVGNKNYSTGTSAAGSSWDDATQAYDAGSQAAELDAFIHFSYGDEWKVVVGDGDTSPVYVESYDVACEGMSYPGSGNVSVTAPGYYRVIYHHPGSGDSVTVNKFSVDTTSLTVSNGSTSKFHIYNWKPTLSVVSNNTSIATVAMDEEHATATVTGVAVGSTTITVSDATGTTFNIAIEVTNTIDIYFTKESWDEVAIYYWGAGSCDWPGVTMTFAYTNDMSQPVHMARIPTGVTGIIFNNKNGTQTVDITSGIANNKGFYLNGEWQDGKAKVGSWDVVLP